MNNRLPAITRMAIGIVCLLPSSVALAATDQEVIAALQAELAALSARLAALEARKPIAMEDYQAPGPVATSATPGSWTDRIRLKGDFRYRHESIDAEFSDDTRNRNRIRARPALVAEVSDSVEVGFGLATGSDDPASTNQTLGESFSSKKVQLDLAYFGWSTPVEGLKLTGGKYKNPLHRAGGNGLLWDSDVRPEGMVATYRSGPLRLTGVVNWVTESSAEDNLAFGGQADWSFAFGEDFKLLLGAGYYDLSSVEGREVPLDGDPRGNSVDGLNQYLYGYQELELFGELAFSIGDSPVSLFADYVENLDAPQFERGWALGGSVGFRHGKRPWKIGYTYQDLEPDAVFAMFTDSDFIGGGTDGRGHIFKGQYALTKNVSLGGSLFLNERGGDSTGEWEDFNRLQLDVEFKY